MINEMIWDWCVENTPDLGIAEEMFFGGISMPSIPEEWERQWHENHGTSEN